MRPIKIYDTGRGVEDIQRRLERLGYDLESCGVDGDFREETQAAVKAFQQAHDLPVTGEVDTRTWSTLVDSTFVFGDRSLYLRRPCFHGQDVRTLQRALGVLGFSNGLVDGIFGPHTERAVTDFQSNMDISPDGAVGRQTYDALNGLRHIWDNRDVHAHSGVTSATRNREKPLMRHTWCFVATDDATQQITRRLANLALASAEHATVVCRFVGVGECDGSDEEICVVLMRESVSTKPEGLRIVYSAQRAALITALRQALEQNPDAGRSADRPLLIVIPEDMLDMTAKLQFQYIAAVILDTLCVIFE